MTERLVVVGADAAGMSAASQARRMRGPDDLQIVAFERSTHTSYAACGIPYWVSGDVSGPEALVARSPEQHRSRGIDLRMSTEVVAVDVAAGTVTARDLATGAEETLAYDHLVLATGASPLRPPVPGIDAVGVYGVQTLDDGAALLAGLEALGEGPRRALIIGGGYIGIEMAEAMCSRGLEVTVITMGEEPMDTLDPDMGRLVHEAMAAMGIDVRTATAIEAIETDAAGRAVGARAGGELFSADLVVLGTGVRPNTALAAAAGLPLGQYGGLVTDRRMRVQGYANVWAGGDCVEVLDLVSSRRVAIALGTHANKHGQVIGTNVGGGYASFPGVVRTAISKVCDLEIARTGLREADAVAAGFEPVSVRVESSTRAGYYPGAQPLTVKMIAERRTGRLLGVQIVGREAAAKRIDAAAVALWNRMTVEEMTALDLGYAPPFSPVWDPVLIAARKAVEAVNRTR
jgi:NADPH-dependent 2,4-dienoyl-CoA reductase/sulfur reductase-like enzyme